MNALVAGMHIGWGYTNRVEDCEFELNYIGLVLTNANNNVNVLNSAMVDNEVGMYIGSGLQLNIEGNVIEGNGGPVSNFRYSPSVLAGSRQHAQEAPHAHAPATTLTCAGFICHRVLWFLGREDSP